MGTQSDTDRYFEFELHNAGAGRDAVGSADLARDHDYVVAVLLRSHYCPRCRDLVRDLADRYDEFATRSVAVVPVLPDIRERALVWHRQYDLPFPLLADPDAGIADDADGTPDRFDSFEPFQRTVPRLPGGVVFECEGERLRVISRSGGPNARDVPTVDSLLARVDACRGDAADPTEDVPIDG